MNLGNSEENSVLCSLSFHRKDLSRRMSAEIHNPVPSVVFTTSDRGPTKVWDCEVRIWLDGEERRIVATNVRWVISFWQALECVRSLIPTGEECEWVDDEGLESWCILPRIVPFSWGYDLYHRISQMSDDTEKAYVEDVERRRLAWEARRSPEGEG